MKVSTLSEKQIKTNIKRREKLLSDLNSMLPFCRGSLHKFGKIQTPKKTKKLKIFYCKKCGAKMKNRGFEKRLFVSQLGDIIYKRRYFTCGYS